jgi:hypothetical protein
MRINKITLIIIFGFLARLAVSIWNGFFGPSYGAELDAQGFHFKAVEIATSSIQFEFEIGHIYSWWLAIWYMIFMPSIFLGSILSVFTWLWSAYLFNKILSLIKADNKTLLVAMILFSFWPTSVMLTSVTLRESYQLLFITIVFYSALRLYIFGNPIYWGYLVVGVFFAGVLHGGLLASGLCITVLTMFYMQRNSSAVVFLLKNILTIPLLLPVVMLGMGLFSAESYDLSGGVAQSVESYNLGGMNSDDTIGRADYRSDINIQGNIGLLLFYPIALLQYLFEPMPWKISSGVDIFTIAENIFRFFILVMAYKAFKLSFGADKKILIFSFLSFLIIESIWALGTKNWGTAARHHIPSLAIMFTLYSISKKIIYFRAVK